MSIAILGDGLMGRSIRDVLVKSGQDHVLLGHADVDVTSQDSLVRALREHRPAVAINTVAYHTLSLCEANPDRAFEINAKAAGRIASLVSTLFLSSDYVFNDNGPHEEGMPGQQPRSVYGRSKMAGELETLERDGIVVRVSGLYHHKYESHKGPSFPTQITSGFDPVTVASDQRFSPTYTPDAAERIVELAVEFGAWAQCDIHEQGYDESPRGIYHAANAGSTTWAEFAQQIVEITRARRIVIPRAKHDSIRPVNSSLRSTRLTPLAHWTDALYRWSIAREKVA